MDNQSITIKEACKMLGVSRQHFYNLMKRNVFKCFNVGESSKRKTWRIKISEIENFIQSKNG